MFRDKSGKSKVLTCDFEPRQAFISRIKKLVDGGLDVEGIVLNAGILKYPNVSLASLYA